MNIYLNTVPVEAEGATVFLLGDTNNSKVTNCTGSGQNKEGVSDEIVMQPEEGAALLFYQVPQNTFYWPYASQKVKKCHKNSGEKLK